MSIIDFINTYKTIYVITLFVTIVVLIAIRVFVAQKFEEIAIMKGHSDKHAFALCFWLGMVGWIYVSALPTLNSTTTSYSTVTSAQKRALSSYSNQKTNNVYNRYDCKSITVTDKTIAGRCLVCKEHSTVLNYCKIEKDTSIKDIPVCKDCIEALRKNAKDTKNLT